MCVFLCVSVGDCHPTQLNVCCKHVRLCYEVCVFVTGLVNLNVLLS